MNNCLKCGELKELVQFYKDKTCKDGHVRKCIICYEGIRKAKKLSNPQAHLKKTQEFWLKHRYGITLCTYTEMLISQNSSCAICSSTVPYPSLPERKTFCVDHDHETGKIRGLLCMPCNRSLGQFKDDATILRNADDYIDFHKKGKNET